MSQQTTLPMDTPIPLEAQLRCAERELRMRREVYPRWVGAKRMTVFKAEDEITAMAAIVKTLKELVENEKRAASKGGTATPVEAHSGEGAPDARRVPAGKVRRPKR